MKKILKSRVKKPEYKTACVSCGMLLQEGSENIKGGKNYCGSCVNLESESCFKRPKGFLKFLVYLFCINPVIGFLIGTLYHSQQDKQNRDFARLCYIIMAAGILLCLFIFILMAVAGSFMSGAEGGTLIQEGYY
ncbi:MAG: hypothetical protein BWY84_01238 [Candidatus Aerophobetes bacterium ADurb.Bin490]|nr:MAG: hypothetical protein BWY84_01238 [Candidatus Aerophobetes bacterium ADurb.Bin490]HPI03689.1 hypothetical protein [Candidatus Goldiibacteriota bacterium]HPN64843.1 hypothetical protein [Candidatus Goldiibacteriota bacterium]HRQ43179.1 hypothetical protein [Candidatus Goldiibacteriota bacterium]